jgi:hypothetical protein
LTNTEVVVVHTHSFIHNIIKDILPITSSKYPQSIES